VSVSIFATDTPPEGTNRFYIMIAEDSVRIGFVDYNHVVRAVLPDTGGMPVTIAYAESLDTTFAFTSRWNNDKLSVIGFLQNIESDHVLQSAIGKKEE